MHFASVQRNAMKFASVVITLRNKALFGSHDFWHGVCIKHTASANATSYQKDIKMLYRKNKERRSTNSFNLCNEKLERRAMFSATGMPEVDSSSATKLDVGPVNQTSAEVRSVNLSELAESSSETSNQSTGSEESNVNTTSRAATVPFATNVNLRKSFSFDKAPMKMKAPISFATEPKINVHDIVSDKAFVNFAVVDSINMNDVTSLEGAGDTIGDAMMRNDISQRFATGPDLSLSEIGFGDTMASDSSHCVRPYNGFHRSVLYDYASYDIIDFDQIENPTPDDVARRDEALENQNYIPGTAINPTCPPPKVELTAWECFSQTVGEIWDWFKGLFSRPAPDDMQGDHPLPAELLVGLVAARDQAFQEFSSLHINGDGRNPEHSPGGAVGPEAYSREDVEEAASLGGANGCGRTDQGSAVNPNALRRTFTLSNTIVVGCKNPDTFL